MAQRGQMESYPGVVCLEAQDGAAGILISRWRIVLGFHLLGRGVSQGE